LLAGAGLGAAAGGAGFVAAANGADEAAAAGVRACATTEDGTGATAGADAAGATGGGVTDATADAGSENGAGTGAEADASVPRAAGSDAAGATDSTGLMAGATVACAAVSSSACDAHNQAPVPTAVTNTSAATQRHPLLALFKSAPGGRNGGVGEGLDLKLGSERSLAGAAEKSDE
jgi:hypothetical protein